MRARRLAQIERMCKRNNLDIEFINSIPKTINENECWIPIKKSDSNGYVRIMINKTQYLLHRLSMCIYNNLNYFDYKIASRHGTNCDHAYFNYNHVIPGTDSDNVKDSVRDKTHVEARKTCCSICGTDFSIRITQTGPNKGKIIRYCKVCQDMNNFNRKYK